MTQGKWSVAYKAETGETEMVVSESEDAVYRSPGAYTGTGVEYDDTVSIEDYLKMVDTDPQIGAGILLINLAILSKPWDIIYSNEEGTDEEIKLFLKNTFKNVNETIGWGGGFRGFLEELLLTPAIGFSVVEPVYAPTLEGKMGISKLKVLPHESIKFDWDEYGNMMDIIQTGFGADKYLTPIEKFLVWTYNKRAGNPYGISFLKRAYKHYKIKEFLIKEWNIYLERKATPVPVGKTSTPRMKELHKMLSNLNAMSAVTMRKEDELDVLDMSKAKDEFKAAIGYHDTMIFRAMLTPTLLLGQEDVGARALGDTHFMVFMWNVNKNKEDIINLFQPLIKTLVDINFGEQENYPSLSIPELSSIEKQNFADVVYKLVTGKVVAPNEEWIRKKLDIPTDPVLLDIEGVGEPTEEAGGVVENDGNIGDGGGGTEEEEKSVKQENEAIKKIFDWGDNLIKNDLIEYSELLTDYFVSWMDSNLSAEDIFEKVRELKVPKKYEKIFVKKIIKSWDRIAEKAGNNADKTVGQAIERRVGGVFSQKAEWEDELDDTRELQMTRLFITAGLLHERMVSNAQNLIVDGKVRDLTEDEIIDRFEDESPGYFNQISESVAGTNTSVAVNAARGAVFLIAATYINGLQYTAVLDEHTTDFCASHDGQILPADDPAVATLTPPNHFMCRSMWVPVYIWENKPSNNWNFDIEPDERFLGVYPQ